MQNCFPTKSWEENKEEKNQTKNQGNFFFFFKSSLFSPGLSSTTFSLLLWRLLQAEERQKPLPAARRLQRGRQGLPVLRGRWPRGDGDSPLNEKLPINPSCNLHLRKATAALRPRRSFPFLISWALPAPLSCPALGPATAAGKRG